MNKVHFSSATVEWATDPGFFARAHAEFRFTVDVCANRSNAKLPRYFNKKQNGLRQDWSGDRCWMNPPYGNAEQPCGKNCKKKRCEKRGHHVKKYIPGIADWVAKAAGEAKRGALVVALLPARTDTAWWHEYIWDEVKNQPRPGVEVRFIKGRLIYGKAKSPAPFPNVLVVFRPYLGIRRYVLDAAEPFIVGADAQLQAPAMREAA